MSQQYVLLKKKNDSLKSLIGQSYNQKSKFEAGRILDEIHSEAQGRLIEKRTLCYVTDKDEILGVGGSTLMKDKNGEIVSNLILNNLGILLNAIFRGHPSVTTSPVLVDEGGIGRNVRVFTAQGFSNQVGKGVVHAIGSGATAPVRANINIETAFGTSPEDANVDPSDPVYNSTTGAFESIGSISAGGSGTINEAVLKCGWNDGTANNRTFSLFRDIVSPAVDFIAGQGIAVSFKMQL